MLFNSPAKAIVCALLLGLAPAGCGGSARDEEPEQTEADDAAALEADAAGLASGVVIRVEVDAAGDDLPATASMRSVRSELADDAGEDALEHGWNIGAPSALTSGDELDRDTSTQSWSDYRATSRYDSYQPTVYYGGGKRQAYRYKRVHRRGIYRYYLYKRPRCQYACQPLPVPPPPGGPLPPGASLDRDLGALLASRGVRPLQAGDFYSAPAVMVQLGERLFNDPLLSGTGTTACSTCHAASLGTSNAMSLGPTLKAKDDRRAFFRTTDLLPRNSPSLYNRGHRGYTSMFWDSRVAADGGSASGYRSPAGALLPAGLSGPLAAQALFPLANRDEMLGCLGVPAPGLTAVRQADYPTVWNGVLQRVLGAQAYAPMLAAAYPGIPRQQIGIAHLANAIAAFESVAWRSDDAPFDRYLRGDVQAMDERQKLGALYFYGKAQCSTCHAGVLQTDHQHHAIAMPQFGPGVGDGPSGRGDYGWERVTGRASDRYKFRTPSLRNVALSGPYGHNGAYSSLRAFIAHYTNPVRALDAWDPMQVTLPFRVTDDTLFAQHADRAARQSLAAGNQFPGVPLSAQEMDALEAFLHALTDPRFARGGMPPR